MKYPVFLNRIGRLNYFVVLECDNIFWAPTPKSPLIGFPDRCVLLSTAEEWRLNSPAMEKTWKQLLYFSTHFIVLLAEGNVLTNRLGIQLVCSVWVFEKERWRKKRFLISIEWMTGRRAERGVVEKWRQERIWFSRWDEMTWPSFLPDWKFLHTLM